MNRPWHKHLGADPTPWLLSSKEPWTRYRTLVDLLDRPESDPGVQAARIEMLTHPQVQALAAEFAAWGSHPLKRHNDASHPIYKLSTLADFGVQASDTGAMDGLAAGMKAVLAQQAPEGAFQTVVSIPKRFGGTGEGVWTWVLCDAPTLLYSLLAMGLRKDPRVQRSVEHLASLIDDNGWHCVASPDLGKFRGPGRKDDPCPIANVYALKSLALVSEFTHSPAVQTGVEMLLGHWERQAERKLYLFGIGTDFRKLKYPYVWYDILHVAEVLSQYASAHSDVRFHQMLSVIKAQADRAGRFTAGSMYRAWKGWSFADKRQPSPWLTLLCCRILKRVSEEEEDEGY